MAKLFTASQTERVMKCPGSCALPQIQSENEFSRRGTVIHKYLEEAVGGVDTLRTRALSRVPDDLRDFCSKIKVDLIDNLIPGGSRKEVSLNFKDAVTGRIDVLVYSSEHDLAMVCDYKTGFEEVDPRTSLQMQTYAVMARRDLRTSAVNVVVITIKDDGNVSFDGVLFDEIELDCFEERLKETIKKAKAAKEAADLTKHLNTGEHCKYCPSKFACPAMRGTINALVEMTKGTEALTGEKIRELYEKTKAVKSAIDVADDFVKSWVRDKGSLDLGNGKELRITMGSRESVSLKVIREKSSPAAYANILKIGAISVSEFETLRACKKV